MAGNGPAPKKNRQRRGLPDRGDWVQLAPLEEPILPELDTLPSPVIDTLGEPQWSYLTRLLWDAWRESPVTAMWKADDVAMAIDTIFEHAKLNADPPMRSAQPSELRIRQEALGLTTKGRQDRRWLLPDETAPDDDTPDAEVKPDRKLPAAV